MNRPAIQAPSAVVMIRPHHFHPNPQTIGDNSCNGTTSCIGAQGSIGANACNHTSACLSPAGSIGPGSCTGNERVPNGDRAPGERPGRRERQVLPIVHPARLPGRSHEDLPDLLDGRVDPDVSFGGWHAPVPSAQGLRRFPAA